MTYLIADDLPTEPAGNRGSTTDCSSPVPWQGALVKRAPDPSPRGCSEAEALAYAERVSVDNHSHVPVRQAFVYRE